MNDPATLRRAREILADPERVVRGNSRLDSGKFCAAGALIHAAGGVPEFRASIDREWAAALAQTFLRHGREAAVAFIDAELEA